MAEPLTIQEMSPKLKLLKPKLPGENAVSTSAATTTRVTALEQGLNLNRRDGGLIQYADISLLVTFQLDSDPDTWYVDVFVYGNPGAFRLPQKAINYRQFLPQIAQRSKDNFYTFLLTLISHTDSIYVDEPTLEFLKSKKMASFPDFRLFEEHTKQLWFQIMTWMKFQCEHCQEVYWVDDAKVTPQGAKTKCVKCQQVITVKKRDIPAPLQPQEKRATISCPHCKHENAEGSQFCAMCQKPLITLTPTTKPWLKKKPAPETPQEQPGAATEAPQPSEPAQQEAAPAVDLSSLPLQAREQKQSRLSFREIAMSLHDDITTLEDKFAWFSKFSMVMQIVGSLFLFGGIFVGTYIRFVMANPQPPEIALTSGQRWMYAGIAAGVGGLLFLACIVVSNIIALTLQIEQNTKVSTLLLQKLVDREEQ